jgi:hypothetical protein
MAFYVLTADVSKFSPYILRYRSCVTIILLPISIAFTTFVGFGFLKQVRLRHDYSNIQRRGKSTRFGFFRPYSQSIQQKIILGFVIVVHK